MALKSRAADSVGGPDGQSMWQCLDETIIVSLQASLTTTPLVYPITFGPQVSSAFANSAPAPDTLAAGSPITRLEGGQLMNVGAATLALQATMAAGLFVVRAGAIVGGTLAFGWLATAAAPTTVLGIASVPLGGGAGTPAFTLPLTVAMPPVAANTALVNTTSGSYMLIQPGDLIAFLQVMQTGTLATPALAVSARVV